MAAKWKKQLESDDPKERAAAIKAIAVSGDHDNLRFLKDIVENDPDPRLQEYARKAARHLHSRPQSKKPNSSFLTSGASEDEDISNKDYQEAEKKVQRAFSLHMGGQIKKGIQVFTQALELNPGLEKDTYARSVASELTGLDPKEAFLSLKDQSDIKELIKAAPEKKKKAKKKIRPLSLIFLLIAVAALVVVSSRFMESGMFDRYRVLIAKQLGGFNQHQAGGYKYNMLKPLGRAPSEGWPVVVSFHGFGGQAADMLPIASVFTGEGIVYIAPTFGGYEPYPGSGPIEPMRQILEDAAKQIPIDQNRVVLLGFSQGGTFSYRFSIYHPEWVSGVVTAGAPDLDAGTPRSTSLPYLFTWGEQDGLQNMVLPASVYPLMNQGYNVRYKIIPNAGHEVTQFAIDSVLAMVGE